MGFNRFLWGLMGFNGGLMGLMGLMGSNGISQGFDWDVVKLYDIPSDLWEFATVCYCTWP